ncbi:MAG TPA: hypothetical protein VFG29_06100 [Syntrophales bacterium]|nr:hypothetical protein [Syntrophales bacterium]
MLSEAAIRRLDGRYWVYHWAIHSGRWFTVPLLPPVNGGLGGPMGPIVSKQFILFLEFDEKNILLSKQFGEEMATKYCTARGLCLEHKVKVAYSAGDGSGTDAFHNMENAFTISGSSKASVPWPTAGGDRCVAVLWPDAGDWEALQGLRVAIGEPPEVPPSWLPVGSYVALSLPVGQQTVRATNPITDPLLDAHNKYAVDSIGNFQCNVGQTVYIEIGTILPTKNRWLSSNYKVSIVLRAIDPETGRRLIADMPRLLPPQR